MCVFMATEACWEDMRLQAAQLSWQPGMEGGTDPMSRFTAHNAGWTGSIGMPNQQRGTNKYESPPGLCVHSGSPNRMNPRL